jgi:transcriptional regulator with XRE-family HTH domain
MSQESEMANKPANRVRAFRKKLKWSQRKLAKQAKTSQQQIQRIETEQRSVRIDLAMRICNALGQPLATVFPKTARTVAALCSSIAKIHRPPCSTCSGTATPAPS